ncbi:MAG: peptidylprolyl isomerase [Holophaga sp.]|nr:peptidylprolyl isomerase [Holophaga sp.]
MKAFLLAVVLCLAIPAARAAEAKPRVQIDTSYGPFVVELEPDLAPKTVANFLRYVKEGFYTDTIFHRVIEGFMVQGGGMLKDFKEKPGHEPVVNEAQATFAAGLKNTRGTVAMARTDDPNSATSQFFVNTVANPALDTKDLTPAGYGYCVFGRVVSGMDVVAKIEKVHTVWFHGNPNVPEFPVRIKSAQLLP